jgi:hypothetical protein
MATPESAAPIGVEKDVRFYARELRSEECQCLRRKKSGHSLCWRCYSRLPAELRGRLYRRIGDGYEQAYEEAVTWLARHSDDDDEHL